MRLQPVVKKKNGGVINKFLCGPKQQHSRQHANNLLIQGPEVLTTEESIY